MPRGRSQQPKAFANRTDLVGKVAAQAPTGMPYGEAKKMQDAQVAVPVSNPDVPKPVAQPQSPAPSLAQISAPQPKALTQPTDFPNEGILTGATSQIGSVDPDTTRLKSYLPLFKVESAKPGVPLMFKDFVKWLDQQ